MGVNRSTLKQQTYLIKHDNLTCFTDLSNELIFELFDYFSFYDIDHTFGNINRRLNDLIDTYPHYINLQQYTPENLPYRIRSIKICARYQVSFLNTLNIESLRALSLSNLTTAQYINILNTISLEKLGYIYLSICPSAYPYKPEELAVIQEKILSLGQLNLKKCLFRMRFSIDINQLPLKLYSLESLRIDGCQNVSIVNTLLDRMPNLKYFRVIILDSILMKDDYSKMIRSNNSLIYLVIQICELKSPKELIPLFIQHCSNVKQLILHLNPMEENDPVHKISDIQFVNRSEWITNIFNHHLLQLENFQIRQRVSCHMNGMRYLPCYVPSYREKLQHPPINVSIAGKLASLWQHSV